MPDNGIKFFAAGGHKLADDVEDRIEAMDAEFVRPISGAVVGRVHDAPDAADRYRKTFGLDHRAFVARCDRWSSIVPMARHRPWGRRCTRAGAKVIAIHSDR